jgi:hypothetical protein
MYSHDNEYLSKLKEHERYLDNLMDYHNGEEEELEYDPCDDIDDDHPKLRRLRGEVE